MSQGLCIRLPEFLHELGSFRSTASGPKFSFAVEIAPANQSDKMMF